MAEMGAGLAEGWSPQQIAGRWRQAGRAAKSRVSCEAIYLRVAADRRAGGELFRLLRRGGRKRRRDRCGTRRGHRLKVRPEQELSQRPAVINERARVGDWEVDLIIGAGQRGAVLVAVERRTRFCRLRLLGDKSAPGVASALLSALKGMPVASMTKDRGLEWAEHERIARRLEAAIYFCRPYHSWEKGLVEQHNGLLREYWPKDMALDTLTAQAVARVEASLNARPRRVLGYATPAEVMLELG
jgi:IS30 family transposase